MASRETSAQMPTASGISLLNDLRAALIAGGVHESPEARSARLFALMEDRKDEVTMTLSMMLPPGDPVGYLMNSALLGMRFNRDIERDELGAAKPLHDRIELQSLRTKCPQCEGNKCGRRGKYHDIVYKTSQKGGTGAERNLIVAMGGTLDNNVLCEVDPDTGRFSLDPVEAKKALRQWGEHAVRATRRWVDRQNRKGDRWKVREVRHHELYAHAVLALQGEPSQVDVQPMTAD